MPLDNNQIAKELADSRLRKPNLAKTTRLGVPLTIRTAAKRQNLNKTEAKPEPRVHTITISTYGSNLASGLLTA